MRCLQLASRLLIIGLLAFAGCGEPTADVEGFDIGTPDTERARRVRDALVDLEASYGYGGMNNVKLEISEILENLESVDLQGDRYAEIYAQINAGIKQMESMQTPVQIKAKLVELNGLTAQLPGSDG